VKKGPRGAFKRTLEDGNWVTPRKPFERREKKGYNAKRGPTPVPRAARRRERRSWGQREKVFEITTRLGGERGGRDDRDPLGT